MSLWTPDGEHSINPGGGEQPELTSEQQEQAREMAKQMAETRAQLLDTEVATVVGNHAFGLYELAAIHITAEDPDMVEARLAVDSLSVLVEGLKGRLGEVEAPLNEALNQIRLAFVQRTHALKQEAAAADDSSESVTADSDSETED